MDNNLYQVVCLKEGMVFDCIIPGLYTLEETNSLVMALENQDAALGTKYYYERVPFFESKKIQENNEMDTEYEVASRTVIDENGRTLYDCGAGELARIAAGDSCFADAALTVLEHDYVAGASDRAYYSRNYGVVWR